MELVAQGWTLEATGDWAWVYRSANGRRIARVCPYDPAYALYVKFCQQYADDPFLPTIHEHHEIGPMGHLTILDHLDPAPEPCAWRFFRDLRRCGPSDETTIPNRNELQTFAGILDDMVVEGRRTVPFFGGEDLQPVHVRRDHSGHLCLLDAIAVDGPRLRAAVLHDAREAMQQISRRARRAFVQIPFIARHHEDPDVATFRSMVAGL